MAVSKFFGRSPGLQVSVKDLGQCDDKSLTLSAFSSLAFKVKRQRFKVTRLPIADYSRVYNSYMRPHGLFIGGRSRAKMFTKLLCHNFFDFR